MTVLITKAQALRLVGEHELQRMDEQNDMSLLMPSGAKIFRHKVGCVRRFGIGGYDRDGSDVKEVLAMLQAS